MTKQNMPRLTESQLFTIEALNRIEGFAWPKDASFACAFNIVNGRNFGVEFYIEKPTPSDEIEAFKGALSKGEPTKVILGQHPDWRNSLITREQFDSVDGWVINHSRLMPDCVLESRVDYLDSDGVSWSDADACILEWVSDVKKWRYHKPSNAEITAAFDDAFNSVAEVSAESWPYVDIIIRMIGLLSSSGVKASQDSQNPAEVWLHDALNLIDNKQPSIPTLTNEQCLKFLCTAFRHNEIKGDIEFDDINLGLRMALSREATHE